MQESFFLILVKAKMVIQIRIKFCFKHAISYLPNQSKLKIETFFGVNVEYRFRRKQKRKKRNCFMPEYILKDFQY